MKIGFMMGHNKERMEFAKKYGFDSVEFQVSGAGPYMPGQKDWEARAKEIADDFKKHNLTISCLAVFYDNHMDPKKEQVLKEMVSNSIKLAKAMKVPVVAGFSGRIPDKTLEESIPKFKEIWGKHAKFAEDSGVKIAFENCPMGAFHTPAFGINMMCTPAMWEIAFNEVKSDALGLEWDPSHLICIFVDPVENLRKFGKKVYHVHAKDAKVNRDLLAKYGFWHPGVIEHCFPGLGDTDWAAAIKELRRQGYNGDLNIEGWHDAVFNDNFKSGMEDAGLIIAGRYLRQFCPEGY